jgi:hypothetical protein
MELIAYTKYFQGVVKMPKKYFLVVGALVIITVAGFGGGKIFQKPASSGLERISSDTTMNKTYTTISDLVTSNYTDTIVEGTVEDVSYFDYNQSSFTLSKYRIGKSFLGNTKPGDMINVVTLGGISTQEELSSSDDHAKMTTDNTHQKFEFVIDGAPIEKKGDTTLLFLNTDKDDFYKLNMPYYDTVGAYQSIFFIDKKNGKINRYTEDPSGDNLSKLSLSQFEQQILNSLPLRKKTQ